MAPLQIIKMFHLMRSLCLGGQESSQIGRGHHCNQNHQRDFLSPADDFVLVTLGLGSFPGFQLREPPAGAARSQRDRLRKIWIELGPAPYRRAVNAVASRDLGYGYVNGGHAMHSDAFQLRAYFRAASDGGRG